ncbi:MAG: hypothetical protein D6767_00120, partial [Candidatus Hydrogenedentota bacterium]
PDLKKKVDIFLEFIILLGVKDKGLSEYYWERRRKLMLASPIYHKILQEGVEKGKKEGLKEGLKEGIKEGIKEGEKTAKLETARRMKDDGFPIRKILEITGLTERDLKENGII